MTEQWRDIPEWEGFYQASDIGRVKSVERVVLDSRVGRKLVKERILRQTLSGNKKDKRYRVVLQRDGVRIDRKTYQLVLEAFVGPRPEGLVACHNDGNRLNNVLSNLRWGTPESNQQDRTAHGRDPVGERNPKAKLTEQDVLRIRAKRAIDNCLYAELAEEYGVHFSTIRNIIRRRTWAWL